MNFTTNEIAHLHMCLITRIEKITKLIEIFAEVDNKILLMYKQELKELEELKQKVFLLM